MTEENNLNIDNTFSIIVRVESGNSAGEEFILERPFRIGRDEECEVMLTDGIVSRSHVEIYWLNDKWWLADLESANGTFVNNKIIDKVELEDGLQVQLGENGPRLSFSLKQKSINQSSKTPNDKSVSGYIDHYFDNRPAGEVGEHTMMIRQAYEVVKKKHSSKYIYAIIGIAVVAVLIGAYAIYQHINTSKQLELAEAIFYDMKSIELEISRLNEALTKTGDKELIASVNQLKSTRKEMEKKYDEYINILDIYDMDEEEQIIVNMARNFGECELNIPESFIDEVKVYIEKWKSSTRLKTAIERAKKNGYEKIIAEKMLAEQLPPHFYYLALQESNFIKDIVGPQTRYGYAKGIWQFIPKTAIKYGLRLGPMVKLKKYDPRDDRFKFEKATAAAAKYLSDIYNTEAQASGLLVMASYNWGEHNVRDLILKMPGNPKDRNFWKLLSAYKNKIPDETYNYVFYIFSAAVIGENPKLFGFDFDNPLSDAISEMNN
ncbi:MAG: FHA domain-containing protein [Ignavibacteriae bacterium]|nr:FHA domain-containing protein [Ignavibacteriota bacterium]NOG96814.1 FHA domain-containing protein [Ignavibacteriota bacterium]